MQKNLATSRLPALTPTRFLRFTPCLSATIATIVLLQGCAVVEVSSRNTAQSLIEQRDSILTRRQLSTASAGFLSMVGQTQSTCLAKLEDCLQQLQHTADLIDEQYLSTASELYLVQAEQFGSAQPECQPQPITQAESEQKIVIRLKKQPDSVPQYDMTPVQRCQQQRQNALLTSVSHAYTYLFASQRLAQQRVFDNRQVQVRDFYNVAVSRVVSELFDGQQQNPATQPTDWALDLEKRLTVQDHSGLFAERKPEQLVAADTLSFNGLRTVNRRDGFGVEFVAVMPAAISPTQQQNATNIHTSRYLPISLVLRPSGLSDAITPHQQRFTLDIYNPYEQRQAALPPATAQSLAANFSAPYGLWLAQNNLAEKAYRSLLALDEQPAAPQLYMLEPYQPNKRVVILLHGLASSPEAWVNLTNDIFGDPVLRRGYQVWQVFYPTNMPMLENRLRIKKLLDQAYQQVDPTGKHAASQHSVLIGHSMGGVIGRMLLSPTDLRVTAFGGFNSRERHKLQQIRELKDYLQLTPLPQVQRAVFISSPFRGTDYADRWFTLALRKIIQLPASFLKTVDQIVERARLDPALQQRMTDAGLLDFQNGASELSRRSHFMTTTATVQLKPNLPFHLMMGQIDPNSGVTDSSDGIVPYHSSHLDGAASERLIQGGHSIQSSPEAVLELRRILRLHLREIGDAD